MHKTALYCMRPPVRTYAAHLVGGIPLLLLASVLFALLSPITAWSHPNGLGEHSIQAHRIADDAHSPTIDGRLDDAAWQAATSQQGTRQLAPQRGEPATEDTEFYIVYDRHNLYVGFRCYDSDPAKVINRLDRRGKIFPSDWISF